MKTLPIGFIGGGNMASAIIKGVTSASLYAPDQIGVYDISAEVTGRFQSGGYSAFASIPELVEQCEIVVLAVKPQTFSQALPQMKPAMSPDTLVVSIAAGITASSIQDAMGFPCKLVLVMPNTPLLVGEGAAALSRIEPATQEDFETVRRIFASAGIAEEVPADKISDSIPLHGSSPAFIYLLAKTLADSAEAHGIDRDTANRLVSQTLIGCAKMMTETGTSHQELIDMVCSPGGTTLAALEAMERAGYSKAIADGYEACVNRAHELAK